MNQTGRTIKTCKNLFSNHTCSSAGYPDMGRATPLDHNIWRFPVLVRHLAAAILYDPRHLRPGWKDERFEAWHFHGKTPPAVGYLIERPV